MSENMASLTVIQPGVQLCLQDLGRFGCAELGLSQGGAMDMHAHCWANKLLGNDAGATTLEIAIGMAKFRAEHDVQLAITGADMQAEVDGILIGSWCSFPLRRGQTLTLKAAQHGMRCYLATTGGFLAKTHWGSASTVLRNQLGRALRAGDVLSSVAAGCTTPRHVPRRFVPDFPDNITLRVMESYQAKQFDRGQRDYFFQASYTLSQDADRMGARLDGAVIRPPATGIISEGIALGSIQIPPDGQPIVLLNDRQTLGGYAKLGCVVRMDLPKLAQARPGTKVNFMPVAWQVARQEWQDFCHWFSLGGVQVDR